MILWTCLALAVALIADDQLRIRVVPCVGVTIAAGTTAVNAAVQAQPEGTTFCFENGTYLLNATIEPKNYSFFVGQSGTIFDGNNVRDRAMHGTGGYPSGQHTVSVSNIEFKNFTASAIEMGWYWTLTNINSHDNKIGLSMNSYSTVTASHIHHNTQYGINGGPGTDMTIANSEVNNNNTSAYCGGTCNGDAGGSKIVGSTAGTYNLVWRNNNVHDNDGMGIWSDGNVRATYENNTVTDNSEGGIFHELSHDAIIRNNTVTNNAVNVAGQSCWWGANILTNTSEDVEVYGNTVTASNGSNGICGAASDRPDAAPPYPTGLLNFYVHNNIIKMNGSANSGVVKADGELTTGSSFAANTYYVTDDTLSYWSWLNVLKTWTTWQAAGQDTAGTILEW